MSEPLKKNKAPKTDGKPSADLEMLSQVMDLLKPVIQFHQSTEATDKEDVHLFWDVRAVKGGGDVIARLVGSSTMSGLLGVKMLADAATLVVQEVDTKISQPLVAKFQHIADTASETKYPELTPSEVKAIGLTPTGDEMAQKIAEAEV